MESFKTEKGTVLPIMNIKGKDYLQVAHRLVWFNEKFPDWSIETELTFDEKSTEARAIIKDDKGRIRSTAHKRVTAQQNQRHYETAETGAVGRALAFIGIGTQFVANELDEEDELADAPLELRNHVATPINRTLPPQVQQQLQRPTVDQNISAVQKLRQPPLQQQIQKTDQAFQKKQSFIPKETR